MTWVVKAANVNQMRQFDLKGREGGTRAGLDKLWNDNTAHGTGSAAWHLRISLCKCARQHDPSNGREIIYFTSYVQYRCVVTPVAEQKTESCCAQNLCFFFFFFKPSGMMLLETKWVLFMWAVLQWAWPWACLRPASVLLCSSLAAKCISLSCGPWPDAFPDPGNRINTLAWAFGSYSSIRSCAIA